MGLSRSRTALDLCTIRSRSRRLGTSMSALCSRCTTSSAMKKSVRVVAHFLYAYAHRLRLAVLVWGSIAGSLGSLTSTWYEHKDIVDQLNTFREVRPASFIPRSIR